MKIGGRKLTNNNLEFVVLPRKEEDGGDIVFKFKPVLSTEGFDRLCPMPESDFISDEKGTRKVTDSPGYQKRLLAYLHKKSAWMFLESISATENLEWENISLENPDTWDFETIDTEIKKAGILENEFNLMQQAYQTVNSLNDQHLEDARLRFLDSIRPKEVLQ